MCSSDLQSVIGKDQQAKRHILRQEMEQIHHLAQNLFGPLSKETLDRMQTFRESLDQ